jgi:hypothetical protein
LPPHQKNPPARLDKSWWRKRFVHWGVEPMSRVFVLLKVDLLFAPVTTNKSSVLVGELVLELGRSSVREGGLELVFALV